MRSDWDRQLRLVLLGMTPTAVAAIAAASLPTPLIIYNPSPSIPAGYYRRSAQTPATGRIIAFRVPTPGRSYAAAHVGYLIREGIIKRIAAQDGDAVCTTGPTGLTINGVFKGPILARDRHGVALPRWLACRRMRRGEYFVFSDRIPNSYDSRYYGPVPASDIIGTFRPLWTDDAPFRSQ